MPNFMKFSTNLFTIFPSKSDVGFYMAIIELSDDGELKI
jgi:hypothetical protein